MDQHLRQNKFSSLRARVSTWMSGLFSSKSYFYIPNAKSEKGSAIIIASMFMLIATFLVTIGMKLVSNAHNQAKEAQLYVGGAQNAARGGIEDALGWFIRQNKLLSAYKYTVNPQGTPTPTVWAPQMTYVDQPFNPVYNTANAEFSDTDQPLTPIANNPSGSVTNTFFGLCNEFTVDANANSIPAGSSGKIAQLFGRYEVAEQGPPPTPNNALAVHDVSGTRAYNAVPGDGLDWSVQSTGYIYRRTDYRMDGYGGWIVPYNQSPNKVLATAKVTSEFRKINCILPTGSAGLYVSDAKNVNCDSSDNSRLNGSLSGTYFLVSMDKNLVPNNYDSTNSEGISTSMNSTKSAASSLNGPISDVSVFGLNIKDMKYIADYTGSSSSPLTIDSISTSSTGGHVNGGGSTPPSLIYYQGDLAFGASQTQVAYQCMQAQGILIVNGSLDLEPGDGNNIQNSWFKGLVFVTGNLTLNQCTIDGSVIMGYSTSNTSTGTNQVTLTGASGIQGSIIMDPGIITSVVQTVARYREDISARKTLLAFPNI